MDRPSTSATNADTSLNNDDGDALDFLDKISEASTLIRDENESNTNFSTIFKHKYLRSGSIYAI
jgi:hypothetical protein